MLDNAARYVYEVYRLKSVSLAAQNLFVSQPAISAGIRKAEQTLGAPIFNRKTLPFTLTAEGKIYIETVERMLALEAQISDRIRDIQEIKGGTLRVASSTYLSFCLIPKLLQRFHRKYPQVNINFHVVETEKIFEQLNKGLADIILIPLDDTPEGYCVTPLFTQNMVVALPADTPVDQALRPYALTREALIDRSYGPEKMVTDLSLFRNMEFVHISPGSYVTRKRELLFGQYSIAPYLTSGTTRLVANYNLMLAGFGALLTTDANIAALPPDPGCIYFVLGGTAARQNFSAVYSEKDRSRDFTKLHAFVDVSKAFFDGGDPLKKLVTP